MKNSHLDQKELRIAYHETGHALVALYFNRPIQKVSLKEMDSPNGSDKYLGHVKLVPTNPEEILTINKAMENVMISLGGLLAKFYFLTIFPVFL